MSNINANPALRLIQAYASAPKANAPKASASIPSDPFTSVVSRAGKVEDQVAISRPEKLAKSVDRLAAGSVSVPAIDKQPAESVLPTQVNRANYTSRGTLAMHGQAGDRNAAATGIAIGKMVDISG